MGIENPIHLLFIGIVALLVLGPKRLPEVARALGHGIREFREAVSQQGEQPPQTVVTPVAQAPAPQPVVSPQASEPRATAQAPASAPAAAPIVQAPAEAEPPLQESHSPAGGAVDPA